MIKTILLLVAVAFLFGIDAKYIIGNGQTAVEGQFPYQALVVADLLTDDPSTICGGALVCNQWVLTAAHCLQTTDAVKAVDMRVGLGNIDNMYYYGIDMIYCHEFYVHDNSMSGGSIVNKNDVGLIKLPEPVEFTPNIQPVGMAPVDSTYVRSVAVVAGWGQYKDGSYPAQHLLYAEMAVNSQEECAAEYATNFAIENIICATGVNEFSDSGTCHGDSGGPLVTHNDAGELIVIGIVGFGRDKPCDTGYIRGFSSVSSHREWIDGIIDQCITS